MATSIQTLHTGAGDIDYAFSYLWYLNGSLSREVYSSGRKVSYSVDGAGRTNKVHDTSKAFVDMTGVSNAYAPDGRVAKMKLRNNLWETREYNAPVTPTVYKLGTALNSGNMLQLEYNFEPDGNNSIGRLNNYNL